MPKLDTSSTLDGLGLELPYLDAAREAARGDAAAWSGDAAVWSGEAAVASGWSAGAWESPYAGEEAAYGEATAFAGGAGGALDIAALLAGPTLRRGHRGRLVATLQHLLRRAGAALSVDGSFGRGTMEALRAFQASRGLRADGVAGPRTRAALAASGGAPAAPLPPTPLPPKPLPPTPPSPVVSGAQRLVVDKLPRLSAHRGTGPDLILRWTGLTGPGEATVVVHFHGYSGRAAAMRIDRDKERDSGLDFGDPADPRTPGRTAPTVAILPRGNFFGGRSGSGYDFPALVAKGALTALVDDALARVSRQVGAEIRPGRLIVTGHSGGGAPINAVLAHLDPDEVQVFDGTYGATENLKAWAARRIARAQGTQAAALPALRVLYRPGSGTAANALGVHEALCRALASAPEGLRRRFRVDATTVAHNDIPRRFGWRLLADAGADLPEARSHSCPGAGADEASPDWHSPATAREEALQDLDFPGLTGIAGYAPNASDLDTAGEVGDLAGEELAWLDYEEASEDHEAEPGPGEPFGQGYEHEDGRGEWREYGEDYAGDEPREAGEEFGQEFGQEFGREFGQKPGEAFEHDSAFAPAWESGVAAEDEFDTPGEAFGGTVLDSLDVLLEAEAGPGSGLADELKGIAPFVLGPELRQGAQGAAVATLQRLLARLGADLAVDGAFGRNTERAVRTFQSRSALPDTGIVDRATKAAIAAALARGGAAPTAPPVAPPVAGDDLGRRAARIAEEEYRVWNPPQRRLTETQPAATPILQLYYREGVRREMSAADLQNAVWQNGHPWSAVFISYVMRKAGAGAAFRYSAAHQTYIVAAKTNRLTGNAASPFWAYRPDEVVPEIGDLICRSRQGSGATYDSISDGRTYATHSDVVTAIRPGEIRVVGGNVHQNVDAKTVRTRPDGRIALDGAQGVIFAVVRCRGPWGGPSASPPSPTPAPAPAPAPSAATRLSPRDFVQAYAAAARASEAASRVPALVTLGQAALESGWGAHAPRFNFFGIKAKASDAPETRQLLRTREVFRDRNHTFPEIISITQRPDGAYDYVVRDWFRAYPSAQEAFLAHGRFLARNKRYAKAFLASDPYAFASAVAAAGYATDPSYATTLHAVMRKVEAAGGAR